MLIALSCVFPDIGLKQWQLLDGDAVAAVNRLYDLVQQYQQLQEARELEQDDLHKAKVRPLAGVCASDLHHSSADNGSINIRHYCPWKP